jgi:hypothetical protein
MNAYRYRKTLLVAIGITTSILWGCGDDPVQTSGSSSSSGQGGNGGGGAGGNGGGGAGGNGGAGGEGGGMMAIPGKTGGSFVSAGHSIKSPKYRLVFTMGQSSPAQSNVKSPNHQMNGGVIGATGSPK